jgi:hypothetical protein
MAQSAPHVLAAHAGPIPRAGIFGPSDTTAEAGVFGPPDLVDIIQADCRPLRMAGPRTGI